MISYSVFAFSRISIHDSVSFGFRDIDDVISFGLNNVLATSGGRTAMLASGFDFQHEVFLLE